MKRAIVKGAVWMLLLRTAERSLGLVSILVLARLLVPADFGLVAMAMSVIAFVELGNSFGFELALIQREHQTRGSTTIRRGPCRSYLAPRVPS